MASINQNVQLENETQASEAYERVKPDLAALSAEELSQVNLDIPTAVATILGVLPDVKALRDQISQELPTFDLTSFDKLEDYALAMSAAQTNYLTATQPMDDLRALAEEAGALHDRLLADATALSKHGLLGRMPFARLLGGNGYKNLAQDLQILSKLMKDNWAQIQGKTPVMAEDLKTANRMSTRLLRTLGMREQLPALVAAAAEARMRAFTKFMRAYEETRRAVAYLRAPQGDADSIAPTLYPGRPKRRQSTEPLPPVVSPPPGPVNGTAPADVPAVSPAPAVTSQNGASGRPLLS